jgi:GrpB-like predicted nucleotidyltransferase (UPF0157 family)
LFEKEKSFLSNLLPDTIVKRIEHFGSTAIPGLTAKPVIDMLIEVTSYSETIKLIIPVLSELGYEYFWRTDVETPYCWFIKRDENGKRSYHIHMVEKESELWDRLYFRDYLIKFPEAAMEYGRLKSRLAVSFPNDRVAYHNGKSGFILSTTKKAKEYFLRIKEQVKF